MGGYQICGQITGGYQVCSVLFMYVCMYVCGEQKVKAPGPRFRAPLGLLPFAHHIHTYQGGPVVRSVSVSITQRANNQCRAVIRNCPLPPAPPQWSLVFLRQVINVNWLYTYQLNTQSFVLGVCKLIDQNIILQITFNFRWVSQMELNPVLDSLTLD